MSQIERPWTTLATLDEDVTRRCGCCGEIIVEFGNARLQFGPEEFLRFAMVVRHIDDTEPHCPLLCTPDAPRTIELTVHRSRYGLRLTRNDVGRLRMLVDATWPAVVRKGEVRWPPEYLN